jgi:hypothetical protein
LAIDIFGVGDTYKSSQAEKKVDVSHLAFHRREGATGSKYPSMRLD